MIRKLILSLTVMLFGCAAFSEAQVLRLHKTVDNGLNLLNAALNVKTSKIDLEEGESWVGFWDGVINENTVLLGTSEIPQDYDCAICYPAGSAEAVGKTIKGIKFIFVDAKNITNVKIWMSSKLPSTPDEADITCQDVPEVTDAQNPDDQMNEVRFDKPFKYDSSKDLYIGYSFRVAGGSDYGEEKPIALDHSKEAPNSIYLKAGGAAGVWEDCYGADLGVIAMQVLVSGKAVENAVSLKTDMKTETCAKGSEINVPFVIENAGTNGVDNFTVNVEIDGNVTEQEITPEEKLTEIGASYQFTLPVKMPSNSGKYELNVFVDKVNGVDNEGKSTVSSLFYVLGEEVNKKFFIEEFTAFWCGWCPRGIIGMEKLRQLYGDQIVPVEIHIGDKIHCEDYNTFGSKTVMGFPGAHVNRTYFSIDPYYGMSGENFGINEIYKEFENSLSLVKIVPSGTIDGDVLTAKADVTFLYTDDDAKYTLGYIITEDDMKDDSWLQHNSYPEKKGSGLEEEEPLFEPWINGEENVAGIVYNDVAIAAKGVESGIEGSLPVSFKEGATNNHSVEFDLSMYSAIQNREKLNVVVFVFDALTGTVVDANSAVVSINTGIENIDNKDAGVVETARYTVDGNRISVPQQGVNIVKYSDGTYKKVIVK